MYVSFGALQKQRPLLAPPARLELTTLRLGGARSIQVSYGGLLPIYFTQESHFCQGFV